MHNEVHKEKHVKINDFALTELLMKPYFACCYVLVM